MSKLQFILLCGYLNSLSQKKLGDKADSKMKEHLKNKSKLSLKWHKRSKWKILVKYRTPINICSSECQWISRISIITICWYEIFCCIWWYFLLRTNIPRKALIEKVYSQEKLSLKKCILRNSRNYYIIVSGTCILKNFVVLQTICPRLDL